jgi:dihydroorotate dehydrogenase (fumarate)
LGLTLRNPLVVSAGPLCEDLIHIRQMEDAGAAAVVLHSLFEEQITRESEDLHENLLQGTESFAEALDYFPDMTDYNLGPEGYLEHIRQAKVAVDIPIIGSLNGVTTGSWVGYARKIQEAGADALELNIYDVVADPAVTSQKVENRYCELLSDIKANLRIPVAVKLSPYFSALANMAQRLQRAGANGLVLFNRFYQPDFDLDNLEVTPSLVLSTPQELLLRLHWVGILYGRVPVDLAVTGGVRTAQNVLKAMMAGASVAMMTSAILKHGIEHLTHVLSELVPWMEERGYASIQQMRGSMSQKAAPDPSAFERANYMKVLRSYTPQAPSSRWRKR